MLQCRHATESAMAASDQTVFHRQREWINLQQQQSAGASYFNNNYADDHGNGWPDLAIGSYHIVTTQEAVSSPPSKKRKSEESRRVEENTRTKKAKGDAVEPKPEMEQTSIDSSDDNDKREASKEGIARPPLPQKTDYIHVRARRGQATDSHSLAERVRREKISERMKYLQDLVPGCNKITGKAGMLDEIINYVQSLQRQVEFLSMKLAAAHPRLDFGIDHLFSKEVNPTCNTSFPTIAMSSEAGDPSYLQFNPMGDAVPSSGLDMTMNQQELALCRISNTLVPVLDTAVDSCLNEHESSIAWENDLQNLYNVEFHQARGFAFPFQFFQGNMVPNNPKMEL